MSRFNWKFKNRGKDEEELSGGTMKVKEPLEPINCAGCEHPIREGDPVILKFAVEHEQADKAANPRGSWRDRLSRALLFYEGLEQLFRSIPQSLHNLYEKNGEKIRHLAEGSATILLLAGKKGMIVLRGVPNGAPIAGGTMAVVAVGVIVAGAIPALNGLRAAGRGKDPATVTSAQYFHASCTGCDGRNCYEAYIEDLGDYPV